MRVWLWHNGSHEETLGVVSELAKHPAVHQFHHSVENVKLRKPTNWLFSESKGDYLSKVDDDCLVPDQWYQKLKAAHEANANIGVVGCWRFMPEDFAPELANRKISGLLGDHQILANCWVEGSGYVMKRACVAQAGLIRERESFTRYCIRLAKLGWDNGWYYPFLYQEHMDDPRAAHSLLKSDADLQKYLPLSARNFGARTLSEWQAQLQRSARIVQEAPQDPRAFSRWRLRRRVYSELSRRFGFLVRWS